MVAFFPTWNLQVESFSLSLLSFVVRGWLSKGIFFFWSHWMVCGTKQKELCSPLQYKCGVLTTGRQGIPSKGLLNGSRLSSQFQNTEKSNCHRQYINTFLYNIYTYFYIIYVYIYYFILNNVYSWASKSLQIVTAVMKLKDSFSLEGKLWQT